MKKTLLLLCTFLLIVFICNAQETTQPVPNKSNRIILHVDDTTGLFTQLARIFIVGGYDIEMKDRELGILRTKRINSYGFAIGTIFRDSTITFYGTFRSDDFRYELKFTKWKGNIYDTLWKEMFKIASMLNPKTITYIQFKYMQ